MKRLGAILITITVMLVIWLAIYIARHREPAYKGRALSEWLLPYSLDMFRDLAGDDAERIKLRAEATEATRAIGTNAIPTLLDWMQAKDTPLKLKLISLAQHQSFMRVRYIDPVYKHLIAKYGFELLGKDARSAVPDLIRIGHDTNYDWDLPFVCLLRLDTNAAIELASYRMALDEKLSSPASTNSSTVK